MLNKIIRIVWIFVVFFASKSCGQAAFPPLDLGTKSGMLIVGSSPEISIGISGGTFIVNWIINSIAVAQCTYFGTDVSCPIVPSTDYTSRLHTSFDGSDPIMLYLQIDSLQISDMPSINVITDFEGVTIVGNGSFNVVNACVQTTEEGINTTPPTNSGLDEVIDFPCDYGYNGNSTGVCQADGTFIYLNNCTRVTCNTVDLSLPENCQLTTSGVVNYGEVINLSCSEGEGKAICDTGGFQVVYAPVEVITLPSGVYTSDVPLVGWVFLIFTGVFFGIAVVLLSCYMMYRRWCCTCLPIVIQKKVRG